jgi:predicted nucleic acid-binding protein
VGAILTTVISRFELLYGAKRAKLARLVQLLEAVPSLGLDDIAADAASEIRRPWSEVASPSGWPTVCRHCDQQRGNAVDAESAAF